MHIFLFFISIYAYLLHQVQQEMGEVLSREWWQSVPYRSFGSWPCKPSQQYLGGRVWVYSLCLGYLPHRSLSSCRRIIYLGQRHVGSVKGESRNARQFLSVVYLLYRRSERQWFLYFRSFSCPSTLFFLLSRINETSSFDRSVSNTMRPLLGSELEAPLSGSTVAPCRPPLPSLQTTGKSLGPWQRAEWFWNFLLGDFSDSAPACSSVCAWPQSSQPDSSWVAQAPSSFATRGCLHSPTQLFLSLSSLHILSHPNRPCTSAEAKCNLLKCRNHLQWLCPPNPTEKCSGWGMETTSCSKGGGGLNYQAWNWPTVIGEAESELSILTTSSDMRKGADWLWAQHEWNYLFGFFKCVLILCYLLPQVLFVFLPSVFKSLKSR